MANVGPIQFFFTFAFDLGRDVSYREIAQRLLNAGIAETVVSPVDGLVRVSRRYKDLDTIRTRLAALRDAQDYIDGKRTFKSLSGQAILQLLRAFIASLPKRRLRFRPRPSTTEEADSELNLDEAVLDLERSVQSAQLIAALQYAVDRAVLNPDYLAGEPYLRLELRPIRLGGFIREEMDFGADEQSDHEVLLLLHKSGIALLTMSVGMPATMPLDLARRFFHAGTLKTTRHSVSEAILRPYGKYYGANERAYKGLWTDEITAGTRWRDFKTEDGVLSDIFEIYHTAVLHASRVTNRDQSWLCYPTAFVERLHCCRNRQEWLKSHSRELVSFASRSSIGENFADAAVDEVLSKDASIRSDSSVLLPGGAVTHLSWNFTDDERQTAADWQYLLTVVEHGVVQYGQLARTDAAISRRASETKQLANVQRGLIDELEEYRASRLKSGTARRITDLVIEGFGGHQLYQRLLDRTANLQQLIGLRQTEHAAKRGDLLAAGAVIATALLGLPAITGTLESLAKVQAIRSVTEAVADRYLNGPLPIASLALAIYGGLLLVILIFVGLTLRRRVRFLPSRQRAPGALGYIWPHGHVSLEIREHGDVEHDDLSSQKSPVRRRRPRRLS